jgi:CRISPR-associated protein Csm4
LTPWQADTVFGNICWIIALREGIEALQQFLGSYRENDPFFILSDGFPGDLFPAPLHLSLLRTKGETFDDYKKDKEFKRISWIYYDALEAIMNGNMDVQIKGVSEAYKTFTTLHSSISRVTGTTGEEGSLFELEEHALYTPSDESKTISLYCKIKDGYKEKLLFLFQELARIGYGKKKSVGKGSFDIVGNLEPFDRLDIIAGANGFMSLSNFIPAKADPTKGFYKVFVKYGKLGGEYAFCGNPFKKPLVMLKAGSVFYTNNGVRPYYGRMIENISPAKPEVVHYAYAFAVPCKIGGIDV